MQNAYSETWTPNHVAFKQPIEQDYNIITNKPVQSYSTNFVNGFGARDLQRDITHRVKEEIRKTAKEQRHQKIVKEKIRKEYSVKDKEDIHR